MAIEFKKAITCKLNYTNIIYFEYESKEMTFKIDRHENTVLKSNNTAFDEIACSKQKWAKYKIISKYVGIVVLLNSKTLKPFVTLGETIKQGDLLCIIKFLNIDIEIKSMNNGFISDICVDDKTIVDYGKILFIIKSL